MDRGPTWFSHGPRSTLHEFGDAPAEAIKKCRQNLVRFEAGLKLLEEDDQAGEAADVEVVCGKCKEKGARRRMAEAFGRDNQKHMPACRGRRPHLRDIDPKGCGVLHVPPILQGASHSWFGVMISALSVP